jgi:ribosome recycling factor
MEKADFNKIKENMKTSLDSLKKEFGKVRTGRASLSLLDGIKVNYYDTLTPLNQIASLNIPESRTITVQPWDKQIIGEIEKAILKSELGLTPINDGNIIRINIPILTEERRKELVKVVKKMVEECKVALRNIRRDANENFKQMKKNKEISEDEAFKNQNRTQEITDEFINKVDELLKNKEKEIMEI